MITIKEGNLFNAPFGLICHQVNCKGSMGRGVAKTFKEKYPLAFQTYVKKCDKYDADELLGRCYFNLDYNVHVPCCMFAQDGYWGKNVCNTNYSAFRKCCQAIKKFILFTAPERKYPINMPYGIGAGLGGGDWLIIKSILEEEFEGYNVILWRLKGEKNEE